MIRVTLRVNGPNATKRGVGVREILSKLIQQSVRTQWKFVVSSQQDLAEIDQMLTEVPPERPEDVFLMPEGVTVPNQSASAGLWSCARSEAGVMDTDCILLCSSNTRGT